MKQKHKNSDPQGVFQDYYECHDEQKISYSGYLSALNKFLLLHTIYWSFGLKYYVIYKSYVKDDHFKMTPMYLVKCPAKDTNK